MSQTHQKQQDPTQPGLKDWRGDFFLYGKVRGHGSQQISQCSAPRIELAGATFRRQVNRTHNGHIDDNNLEPSRRRTHGRKVKGGDSAEMAVLA